MKPTKKEQAADELYAALKKILPEEKVNRYGFFDLLSIGEDIDKAIDILHKYEPIFEGGQNGN